MGPWWKFQGVLTGLCPMGVSEGSREVATCFKVLQRIAGHFRRGFRGVFEGAQRGFKEISGDFQGVEGLQGGLKLSFRGFFLSIANGFQGSFKVFLEEFEGGFAGLQGGLGSFRCISGNFRESQEWFSRDSSEFYYYSFSLNEKLCANSFPRLSLFPSYSFCVLLSNQITHFASA